MNAVLENWQDQLYTWIISVAMTIFKKYFEPLLLKTEKKFLGIATLS